MQWISAKSPSGTEDLPVDVEPARPSIYRNTSKRQCESRGIGRHIIHRLFELCRLPRTHDASGTGKHTPHRAKGHTGDLTIRVGEQQCATAAARPLATPLQGRPQGLETFQAVLDEQPGRRSARSDGCRSGYCRNGEAAFVHADKGGRGPGARDLDGREQTFGSTAAHHQGRTQGSAEPGRGTLDRRRVGLARVQHPWRKPTRRYPGGPAQTGQAVGLVGEVAPEIPETSSLRIPGPAGTGPKTLPGIAAGKATRHRQPTRAALVPSQVPRCSLTLDDAVQSPSRLANGSTSLSEPRR